MAQRRQVRRALKSRGSRSTPFIGGRFGGTFDVQPEGAAEARASLGDSVSFGVSAGLRFDDFSLIEFRWTRASSVLRLDTGVSVNPLTTPIADVTLNQFHGDFTREFPLDEVNALRPFIMASVGATHLGTSSNGFTRFSFGLGTGLKVSVNSKLANPSGGALAPDLGPAGSEHVRLRVWRLYCRLERPADSAIRSDRGACVPLLKSETKKERIGGAP